MEIMSKTRKVIRFESEQEIAVVRVALKRFKRMEENMLIKSEALPVIYTMLGKLETI